MRRKHREPEVVLTGESGCVYCGHPSSEAECEGCGVALESLKALTWTPIVKHRIPDLSPSV
jgi:hypothetical protein